MKPMCSFILRKKLSSIYFAVARGCPEFTAHDYPLFLSIIRLEGVVQASVTANNN
jgi:hypothetical protein